MRALATTQRLVHESSPDQLLNRELSWLDLNARVLDLAADPDQPLLERVRFCAIFSSNLDEFFMVRVAGLLDQVAAGLGVRSPDGRTPQQTLAEVRQRVLELTARQSELWRRELRPALADEGILVGTVDDATEAELEELEATLRAPDLPGADAARRRPGAAVPLHLGPVALARRDRARPRDAARSASRA